MIFMLFSSYLLLNPEGIGTTQEEKQELVHFLCGELKDAGIDVTRTEKECTDKECGIAEAKERGMERLILIDFSKFGKLYTLSITVYDIGKDSVVLFERVKQRRLEAFDVAMRRIARSIKLGRKYSTLKEFGAVTPYEAQKKYFLETTHEYMAVSFGGGYFYNIDPDSVYFTTLGELIFGFEREKEEVSLRGGMFLGKVGGLYAGVTFYRYASTSDITTYMSIGSGVHYIFHGWTGRYGVPLTLGAGMRLFRTSVAGAKIGIEGGLVLASPEWYQFITLYISFGAGTGCVTTF